MRQTPRKTPTTTTTTTTTTTPPAAVGIYAPPDYQTDPSAVKRIMAAWLERDPGGALVAHMYVIRHADPRRVVLGSPDHFAYDGKLAGGNILIAVIGAALRLECGAVWILPTPVALEVAQPNALEVITEADARKDAGFPWLAHELSAGKHATELAGMVIQRRREDTGKGIGMPVGVYFAWVGGVWPTLPGLSAETEARIPTGAPTHTRAAVREVFARLWLEGVALAAYALEQQIRFSPSYTGMVTLRRDLAAKEKRRGGPLPRLSPERAADVLEHKPTYLQWRSRFADHDLSGRWVYVPSGSLEPGAPTESAAYIPVYVYDRNWSFVTAAREVPIGEPVATNGYRASDPGYYHVLGATPPADWPTTRPGPFHTGDKSGSWPGGPVRDVWAWEAQIRQALRQGWRVDVEYGWYWPNRTDLRTWQTKLWNARRAARAVAGGGMVAPGSAALAEGIIKRAGVATVGRLAQRGGRAVMRTARARETGADILSRHVDASGDLTGYADVATNPGRMDLYRPEWWGTVISNANERTLAAIYEYAPDDTLLAYVDGIYTLEAHPALDGNADKAGGWRYKGVLYIPVTALERLDTLSPYELVKAFGRYGVPHAGLSSDAAHDDTSDRETVEALQVEDGE